MRESTRGSYVRVDKSYRKLEQPFTLTGIQLWTRRKQQNAATAIFYVRDFLLTNLDHNLLMHLALGYECRVYDFGSRGYDWEAEQGELEALKVPCAFADFGPGHERALAYMRWRCSAAPPTHTLPTYAARRLL
mgnify:CR=1 FL=1